MGNEILIIKFVGYEPPLGVAWLWKYGRSEFTAGWGEFRVNILSLYIFKLICLILITMGFYGSKKKGEAAK